MLKTPSTGSTLNDVLIIGAGIVGLTLAQGLREAGIPFQIFEKLDASDPASQGWGLTLHWSLNALERTIGPQLFALLPETSVDPSVKEGEGGFLLLNGTNCEPRYHVYPRSRFLRAGRQKLREVLSSGLPIQFGKQLQSFDTSDTGCVTAKFSDGTTSQGRLLVGADGNNSAVRPSLTDQKLESLPVNLIGAVRNFTSEQFAPVRALNPLLFFAVNPKSQVFFFYSTQEVLQEEDGTTTYDALVGLSWMVHDNKDAIPPKNKLIAEMKRRVVGFAEPLLSMVMDIPGDSSTATGLRMRDFPCVSWDNANGLLTLVGDAAHTMTMYRGEGANHGILDASLLVDQLKKIHAGEVTQEQGLKAYETEMWERTRTAVLRSRQAALDAHDWDKIDDASPLIGARIPPATA